MTLLTIDSNLSFNSEQGDVSTVPAGMDLHSILLQILFRRLGLDEILGFDLGTYICTHPCDFCEPRKEYRRAYDPSCLMSLVIYRDEESDMPGAARFVCQKCWKKATPYIDSRSRCIRCGHDSPLVTLVNYDFVLSGAPIVMAHFCTEECKKAANMKVAIELVIIQKRCSRCPKKALTMKRCSQCHERHYCSRDCQLADWPEHKRSCTKTSVSA